MYLFRAVNTVPFGAAVEFEDWWTRGQAVLATCPGNLNAGPGIGLWNSLAYPSQYLVLTAWDDHAAAMAAVRGALGAWLRDNPLPVGTAAVRPGEGWEQTGTPPAPDGEQHRYLRQVEYTLRPNTAARFEHDVAEVFALLEEEAPEVRARVLYRSAGIPLRYRVVLRMTENTPLSPRVLAWLALHPYTEYSDERWVNELYVRAV